MEWQIHIPSGTCGVAQTEWRIRSGTDIVAHAEWHMRSGIYGVVIIQVGS